MSKETFAEAIFDWLDLMTGSASVDSFRYKEHETWVKQSDGSFRSRTLLVPTWSELYIDELRRSELWQRIVDEAGTWPQLADHIANNCGCAVHYGTIHADLALLLSPFFPPATLNNESQQVDVGHSQSRFDAMFAAFAEFIESSAMRFRYTTVISGLTVPGSVLPFSVDDDVVLERLSPEMAGMFGSYGMIRGHMVMGRSGLYENPQCPWLSLRWSRSFPKVTRTADIASFEAVQQNDRAYTDTTREAFLGALALTGFGVAFLGSTATTSEGWGIGGFSSTLTSRTPDTNNISGPITLDVDGLSKLRTFFVALRNRKERDDKISTASRRLAFAMENSRDEDRFLDGMIAGEALVGEPREIRYQFALRCAFLLEPTRDSKRREVFDNMLHAYDVRSAFAHGAKASPSDLKIDGVKVSLNEFLKATEDVVRRAIGAALISGKVPDWKDLIVGKHAQVAEAAP